MISEPIISLENVAVNTSTTTKLIENISLSIPKNSATLLLGPTGSGKTTILRVIKGIIPYLINHSVTGKTIINNQEKNLKNYFRQSIDIGYLFQDFDLQFTSSTVEQELIFSLENLGQPETVINNRLQWVLSAYPHFKNILRRNPHTLSGGELAQVIFMSTILGDPEILLLDEPLQNLDKRGTESLLQTLQSYKDKKTIIISSHQINQFIKLVDNVIVLNPINQNIDIFSSKKEFLSRVSDYPWLNMSNIASNHYLKEL